jgi:uncharacterized protein (TIGR02757 family)
MTTLNEQDLRLKAFLDRKVEEYNQPSFIAYDPIVVPHSYAKKQDVEIAGFFAAIFAWGNRTTIINKARELMKLMDNSPHDFIRNHKERERKRFEGFSHRTFNTTDLLYFISFLQVHYKTCNSLEDAFIGRNVLQATQEEEPMERMLNAFYERFFSLEHVPARTRKHVAAPAKNSACKRLNMFLRWMVRKDKKGVDFGIWSRIAPHDLICPLDLHVARVARRFGLIGRPLADWKSAVELTAHLRRFDANDPARYDFALFALGINEKF